MFTVWRVGVLFATSPPYVDFTTATYLSQTNWDGGVGTNTSTQYTSATNISASTTGQIAAVTSTSGWYDNAWAYRRQITIDSSLVSSTESDFPILITEDNLDASFFSNIRSSGQDIVFTSDDGTTVLDREITSASTTAQTLQAWVRIPSLSSSTDTNIYVYYGNPSASLSNSTSVWTSNSFRGVWHLESNASDSTGNGNAGTLFGTTASSSALVGGGLTFNGSGDYISVPDDNTLDISGAFSMTIWFSRASATPANSRLMNKAGTSAFWQSNYNLQLTASGDGNSEGAIYTGGTNLFMSLTGTYPGTNWYSAIFDYDGTTASIYRNGALVSSTPFSGTPLASNQPLYIGAGDPTREYFGGTLDELRLAGASRSAGWIATEYNNISNPSAFYSVGSEVSSTTGSFSTGTLVSAIFDIGTAYTGWGTARWTTDDATNTIVKVRTSDDSGMSGATDFDSCSAVSQDTDLTSNGCVTDGHRYVQYQVELATTTATFQDITIQALGSNSVTVAEDVGSVTITASIDEVSASDVTVPFTVSGSATNPDDHDLGDGSIVISAGQLYATTSVTIVDDSTAESSETIVVTMGSPTNGQQGNNTTFTVLVLDDDTVPTVTLSSDVNQLDENGGASIITATLSTTTAMTATITLAMSGTATVNTDFTTSSNQIVIPSGSTTGSITLTGVSDTSVEGAELIIVDISATSGATELNTQQETISIIDYGGALDVTRYHTSPNTGNPSIVSRYEVFEITLDHPVDYGGQNNFTDINVFATFTSPLGDSVQIKGFYYDTVTTTPAVSTSLWKIRFASSTIGDWSYTYNLEHPSTGNQAFGSGTFEITTGTRKGFVRQNPNNVHRWQYEGDNSLYFPYGFQDCYTYHTQHQLDGGTTGGGAFADTYGADNVQKVRAYKEAGYNTLRVSPRNCSIAIANYALSIWFPDTMRHMDSLLQLAHREEISIFYGLFGYININDTPWDSLYPSSPPSLTGSATQPVLDMIEYSIARWGAYVDFWQLTNEVYPSPTWLTSAASEITAEDPYNHPITTSWNTTTVSGIEVNAPHVYAGGNHVGAGGAQKNLNFTPDKVAGFPVIYGEFGRNGTNWTTNSQTKMRLVDWTAFFSEVGLIRWDTSYAVNGITGSAANNYLGLSERQQARVLSWFVDNMNYRDLAITTSTLSNGPTTATSSALISDQATAVYIEHSTDHANVQSGTTLTVNSRINGTGYWINPRYGDIISTTSVTIGDNVLSVPDYYVDLAFFTTSSASPVFAPLAQFDIYNPQDDGNLDNDSTTNTWDSVTYPNGQDIGPPVDPFGIVPFTIGFFANSSTDHDGGSLTYTWDFGDGNTDTGVSVTHTYSNRGQYYASLTVTDDEGYEDVATFLVRASGDPNFNVNDAPRFNTFGTSTLYIHEWEHYVFTPFAFDVEATSSYAADTPLTYSVTGLPSGASYVTTTQSNNFYNFLWVPDFSQAGQYTVTFTVQDSGALSHSQALNIVVEDMDTIDVTISTTSLALSEDGTQTNYTIALASPPTSSVTVALSAGADLTISTSSIVFTTSNWDSPVAVTVQAVDDSDVESTHTDSVSHTVSQSGGGQYDGISASSVQFTITDNDTTSSSVQVTTSTVAITEAGSTATYTIALGSAPTSTVTIAISADSESTVSTSSISFTSSTYSTPQTITVTAADDSDIEGTHSTVITHTASQGSGGVYDGISVSSVTMTITDNDSAGVTISTNTLALTEGGATDTYTVVLDAAPTSSVVVTLSGDSQASPSPSTLTFTTGNWDTPQTVTVTATDDDSEEGTHSATISHSVSNSGGSYDGFSISDLTFTVTDNDTASVVLSTNSITITEGGSSGSYTIVLATQPSSSVQIDLTTSTSAFTVSTSTIVFSTSNWDTARTVTVTPPSDDAIAESVVTSTISYTVTSGDSNYNGFSITDTSITLNDDDTAGITASDSSIAVIEGGTNNFTLQLASMPTATTTLSITSSTSGLSLSTSSIQFAASAYNSAVTVTITADDNSDVDGSRTVTLTVAPTSADSNYSGVSTSTITVTITDDDAAASSESGGSPSFAFLLSPNIVNTTPSGDPSSTGAENSQDITCPLTPGEAYKGDSSSAVYLVTSICTLRPFQNPEAYFSYFDSWEEVTVLPQSEIDTTPNDPVDFVPKGPKYDPKYGALVKTVNDPKVYLLLGTERYWINSEDVFTNLNYNWNWIEDVSPELLNKYTVGEEITYTDHHPNYTIVKYPNDPKVYRLEPDPEDPTNQVKRHIPNESTFESLNFRWDRIVVLDPSETYPDGEELK